jgi:proteasome accessory factor B
MRTLRDTGRHFQKPADFSIAKHLRESFGVFTGSARTHVRIHFDAFAARLVSERQWHASQEIAILENGEIELSLALGGVEEIERWILSWGEHATVLEPPALRQRLRETAQRLGDRYCD